MTDTPFIAFAAGRRRDAVASAALWAFAFVRRAYALRKDRRDVRRLAELDDHMLKDIGLVRGQVHGALAEPLHRSPSRMLVAVSGRDWPRHGGR